MHYLHLIVHCYSRKNDACIVFNEPVKTKSVKFNVFEIVVLFKVDVIYCVFSLQILAPFDLKNKKQSRTSHKI